MTVSGGGCCCLPSCPAILHVRLQAPAIKKNGSARVSWGAAAAAKAKALASLALHGLRWKRSGFVSDKDFG